MIGNKTDLNQKRQVSYEAGLEVVREWRQQGSMASFIETSARTGDKVEEVFATLLNSIDTRSSQTNGPIENNSNRQQPNNQHELNGNNKNKCIIS